MMHLCKCESPWKYCNSKSELYQSVELKMASYTRPHTSSLFLSDMTAKSQRPIRTE